MTPTSVIERANAACNAGAYRDCIETYESFADEGGVHPDVSYNRGLAYLTRVQSGQPNPGDLGRAAAAFQEAIQLRGQDEEAEKALHIVRGLVAKKLAKTGAKTDVQMAPPLADALAGLASEQTWGILALGSAFLLTLSIVLRHSGRHNIKLAAQIGLATLTPVLIASALLTAAAQRVRHTIQPAVVIAEEIRLTNAQGAPINGAIVPEAAQVDVLGKEGGRVKIRWGDKDGYAPLYQVRLLAR